MKPENRNGYKRKPVFTWIILLCIIALVAIAFMPAILANYPWVRLALYGVIFLLAVVDLIQSYRAAKKG